MSWVVLVITVSMTRSRLARRLAPVSVRSTMASTRSGTFVSVAPWLNSTSASTPRSRRNLRVTLTSSVLMRLPCRSSTLR